MIHPRIEFYDRKRRSSTITGNAPLPRHLAIAFGRYIFRLMHTPPDHPSGLHRPSIYLRDLSLSVDDHLIAYRAYVKECARREIKPVVSRSPARHWFRSKVPDSDRPILLTA
jgi:hypothetical protein